MNFVLHKCLDLVFSWFICVNLRRSSHDLEYFHGGCGRFFDIWPHRDSLSCGECAEDKWKRGKHHFIILGVLVGWPLGVKLTHGYVKESKTTIVDCNRERKWDSVPLCFLVFGFSCSVVDSLELFNKNLIVTKGRHSFVVCDSIWAEKFAHLDIIW